jgi:hypothetical protein
MADSVKYSQKYLVKRNCDEFKKSATFFGPQPCSLRSGIILYIYNPSALLREDGVIFYLGRITPFNFCPLELQSTLQTDPAHPDIEAAFTKVNERFQKSGSLVIFWTSENPEYKLLGDYWTLPCDRRWLGLQDGRFFKFRDEIYVYVHYRGCPEKENEYCHSPIIYKAFEAKFTPIFLKFPGMGVYEKNWMPFEFENQLYIEYSFNPHIILKCDVETGDCEIVARTESKCSIINEIIGGSAPAIAFTSPDGTKYFLGFAHVSLYEPRVVRKPFFYVFEHEFPFRVLGMTEAFDLMEKKYPIEFNSGFYIDQNNVVVMLYGVQDSLCARSQAPLSEILAKMVWFEEEEGKSVGSDGKTSDSTEMKTHSSIWYGW